MDKPQITIPEGEAPTELQIEDLTVGDGEEATSGSSIAAHYVGVAWSTGAEFDNSYDRGAPIEFPLGGGMVIAVLMAAIIAFNSRRGLPQG